MTLFLHSPERFIRKKKKAAGSNAKNFTEGWVEFRDKRVAKLVAASLHNTPIGVRKKSKFHYDLWNIKVCFLGLSTLLSIHNLIVVGNNSIFFYWLFKGIKN